MSDVSADHDPIELVEITDPAAQADLLQAVFDTVLRPSFSTDELPSIDVLRRGASDEHEQTIIVAIDVRGPAAAAVYGRPAGLTVGVLSYLAARPGERGRGLGGRLLARLAEIAERSTVELVLGEVHDPRWYEETDDEHPEARLRFYQRHGARLLAVPWIQPRLAGGGERVRDMLLLALYANDDLVDLGVPGTWIENWAEAFYAAEEGAEPDDEEYDALIERLTATSTIALLGIDQIDSVGRLDLPDRPE